MPKSILKRHEDGDAGVVEYDVLAFVCPGCASDGHSGLHMLAVNTDLHSPAWTWDGNLDAPTLTPSILTQWGMVDAAARGVAPFTCHSFLTAGVFHFLEDSTHRFAGQDVPMPDLEDWMI